MIIEVKRFDPFLCHLQQKTQLWESLALTTVLLHCLGPLGRGVWQDAEMTMQQQEGTFLATELMLQVEHGTASWLAAACKKHILGLFTHLLPELRTQCFSQLIQLGLEDVSNLGGAHALRKN